MLKEGNKAPTFSLVSDSGKKVSLRDFKGKTVVLYFYPKDLTPGCTMEACDFRDNLGTIKRKKSVVLGISADPTDKHGRFIEKNKLNFPLLSDEDKSVCRAYGVWKQKSLYGKMFMGIERTTFIISPAGKIQKIFPKVKIKGHVQEVLESLKKQKDTA